MSARALHLDFPRGGARVAFWPVAVAAGTAVLSAAAAVILGPAALALPFGLALVAVLVRYPPALLVIYGYIGIFKGEPLVADLPFDVTLVLGVLARAGLPTSADRGPGATRSRCATSRCSC